MRFVIVTGMSGAGKSTTLKMMEDMGYFCVDNMPIPLMTKLTELLIVPNGEITKIALGLDIRSGQNLRALDQVLDELEKAKIPLEILFLESNDDTLVKRYKETRRNHPLSKGGRIENGIAKERKKIAFLKERADYILDTSRMLTRELRSELNRIFAENKEYKNLYITVLSFGFKYGIPSDADLSDDLVDASYAEQKQFFAENFPETAGWPGMCESWLLSPALKELLPSDSRILAFAARFEITQTNPDATDYLEWVYKLASGQQKSAELENLREDTSLQRRMKDFLRAGGKVGIAWGIWKES